MYCSIKRYIESYFIEHACISCYCTPKAVCSLLLLIFSYHDLNNPGSQRLAHFRDRKFYYFTEVRVIGSSANSMVNFLLGTSWEYKALSVSNGRVLWIHQRYIVLTQAKFCSCNNSNTYRINVCNIQYFY